MITCTIDDPMRVHRYYDGELDEEARACFEAHLPTCSTCQDTLESLGRLGIALRQRYAEESPLSKTGNFVVRARELQIQRNRRIAWALLAAASFLLISSLSLVGYSQLEGNRAPAIMTRWEEEVVSTPVIDEELIDLTSRTLVAIHVQERYKSESGE